MMKVYLRAFVYTILITMICITVVYSQDETGSFVFEGRVRNYDVYLPQNFQSNMPVVLNLHGWGWTPGAWADNTLMHEVADTSGFIVVYPEGSSVEYAGWNNGFRNESSSPTDTTSNDVGYISALIDTLDAHYDIDLTRVYSCGFSMGGEMTYRLVMELGHRFAAIASVSGKLNDISGNLGDPLRPYPVLHIHGTADGREFYGPGEGNLWSVVETLNFWIDNNLCLLPADTVTLPDLDPNDGSTVEKISFTNCSGNSSIIHFKVINGGHSWPGSIEAGANQDINANVEIWNFFKNYVNPLTNIAYGKKVEVSPKCFPPLGDTLIVNARLSNPESHTAQVHATIKANNYAFRDTIQLFDDGQHHDLNAFDNIWGAAKWFSGLQADNYIIDLSTKDITTDMTTLLRPAAAFTTIGPVVFENSTLVADTLAPNDYKSFDILLRNLSVTDTARNISAWIASKDSCVLWGKNKSTFGDIAPGAVSTSENKYTLLIDPSCNSSRQAKFDLFILSEGYFFWQDSVVVTNIEEQEQRIPNSFVLEQNYPNPFNPSTKIKFALPKAGKVKIEVFNLLGQRIETLLNKSMSAGSNEVEFTAKDLPSGIYLYRIEAGEFQQVRKMILLK